VVSLATLLLGHLAGPECRRALARGWLLVVRGAVGTLEALVVLALVWYWWMVTRHQPSFVPSYELGFVFSAAAMILLVIAVVQAPAVLAGSLAGERERGVLQLLLTTAVSAREIVAGRVLGKLSQVGMILLAGLPFLALLGVWNGFGLGQLATLTVLLAAVGVGGGGLAVGASVLSRRGRDALLAVYILMILLTLSPLLSWLGLPREVSQLLLWFNPFVSMAHLVGSGQVGPALRTAGVWLLLGLGGMAVAVWRLRPSCLAPTVPPAKRARRGRVPLLGERPMLWKELHIERAGTLGRFGRWLGILVTVAIGGGGLMLAGIILWSIVARSDTELSQWARDLLRVLLGGAAGTFLGWMLQWGVGLRAAVSIASERERRTWDALLMSRLRAAEIGVGKLLGSLYALRWMAGALVLAWTLGAILEVVTVGSYVKWVTGNLVACTAMAAIGVRCSLSLPTATRAMTWTIALWLVGYAVVAMIALSIIVLAIMATLVCWLAAVRYGLVAMNSTPWTPMSWAVGWPLTTDIVTLVITLLIFLDTAVRFDRIAGRMAGGAVASKVDTFLRGGSYRPVLLPDRKSATVTKPAPMEPELAPAAPAGALQTAE
jgi:ABC-type Na+ efflux pump permease subunit